MADSDFGALLRTLRIKANLSQEDLAARAGLSTQAVGALERGVRRAPYRQTLDALATALDLQAHDRTDFHASARRFRQATTAAAPSPPPHNLPAAPGRLIGRDTALAAMSALLARPEVRLLAITGPAGVGKTRLALALATEAYPFYPDGAWFVDLAPTHDPALVPTVIAQALGLLTPRTMPPLAALQTALRPKHLLLVLDNLEQVLAATVALDTLLATCPQVHLLITSRITPPTTWAHEYVLPPLGLPDGTVAELAELAAAPAVDFFVQRARASVPDFRLTPGNAPVIAALCRSLDGLPLALELAAMRLRLLPPAELLARLTDRFDLLRSVQTDRPARHQHLRETLAWSEGLLSPTQQQLFRRLAVFVGGTTVAAIEAVCAEPGTVVLDDLTVLIDHHLVRREPHAAETIRLTQLETIREYALERLRAAGEEAALSERHAHYYAEQCDGFEMGLTGPDQLQLLGWCDQERENLRAALAWCRAQGDHARGLQLCWELWRWWSARSLLTEARQWFDAFLDPDGQLLPDIPSERQALALFAAARLAYEQDDLATAQRRAEQSLHLDRLHDPASTGGGALTILAYLAFRRGDYDTAHKYHIAALWLRYDGPFQREVAVSLIGLGDVAAANNDLTLAETYYGQALTQGGTARDDQLTATAQIRLSRIEERQRRFASALTRAKEGLALARALGELPLTALALRQLANLALIAETYRQAGTYLDEALSIARTIGGNDLLGRLVDDYARLLAALGEQASLLQLTSAAVANRAANNTLYLPHQRAELDRLIAAARCDLGSAESAHHWAIGAALTLEAALEAAQRYCAEALSPELNASSPSAAESAR